VAGEVEAAAASSGLGAIGPSLTGAPKPRASGSLIAAKLLAR
jgi:hypothetical protein